MENQIESKPTRIHYRVMYLALDYVMFLMNQKDSLFQFDLEQKWSLEDIENHFDSERNNEYQQEQNNKFDEHKDWLSQEAYHRYSEDPQYGAMDYEDWYSVNKGLNDMYDEANRDYYERQSEEQTEDEEEKERKLEEKKEKYGHFLDMMYFIDWDKASEDYSLSQNIKTLDEKLAKVDAEINSFNGGNNRGDKYSIELVRIKDDLLRERNNFLKVQMLDREKKLMELSRTINLMLDYNFENWEEINSALKDKDLYLDDLIRTSESLMSICTNGRFAFEDKSL